MLKQFITGKNNKILMKVVKFLLISKGSESELNKVKKVVSLLLDYCHSNIIPNN